MKSELIYDRIIAAVPLLDELERLPDFIESIRSQNFREFELVVIVNQPDEWWDNEDKLKICRNNNKSLEILSEIRDFPLRVIDKSSRGRGWQGRRHGVGWARKILLDDVKSHARPTDLIVSLDADTFFAPDYFHSLISNFNAHPKALALSVPYYHRLTGNESADRAILHYEIYMRSYSINLWRIRSPYSFSALGSALVFPIWAYNKIGGMSPMMSGEDFYFLQKMVKAGPVLFWNEEKVYPEARFSDRVYFGTGPAMIKGREGDWSSYPIYDMSLFDKIALTTGLFPELFHHKIQTPLDDFLTEVFPEKDPWQPLRMNNRNIDNFVRACHERLDGLRILQYLKREQKKLEKKDEICLWELLSAYSPDLPDKLGIAEKELDFDLTSLVLLDQIRNILVIIESEYQQKYSLNI